MLITGKFVFLHLHKSGGTFVNRYVRKVFPQAKMIGYHLPYSEIPQVYAHLPVFGLVRNPWSYYVSWFTFQTEKPRRNALFNCVSNDGTLDFKATISNLLNLSDDHERVDFLAAHLPREYPNRGINLTGQAIETIRDRDIGFYTFLYHRMYSGCPNITIGSMETLREDFLAFLIKLGTEPGREERSALLASPKLNTTAHGDVGAYYDSELSALVAAKDRLVLEHHHYDPPQGIAKLNS